MQHALIASQIYVKLCTDKAFEEQCNASPEFYRCAMHESGLVPNVQQLDSGDATDYWKIVTALEYLVCYGV